MLATVFLVQNSRLIAAAAGFDVNTYCHGLGAGICGLNPTDTAFTIGIARIGGYIGHICHSGDMSEVASLPSRAADAGKKTSPWKERIVLLTCIFAAWQIFDDVVMFWAPLLIVFDAVFVRFGAALSERRFSSGIVFSTSCVCFLHILASLS